MSSKLGVQEAEKKKTATGHCDICDHWGILYPVRRAAGDDPEETDVVCVCVDCLSAEEKKRLDVVEEEDEEMQALRKYYEATIHNLEKFEKTLLKKEVKDV
jgi:hypothetical protein